MATREAREQRLLTMGRLLNAGATQTEVARVLGMNRSTICKMAAEAKAADLALQSAEPKKESSPALPPSGGSDGGMMAELEILRQKADRGLDVAPQMSILMARKCQTKLSDDLAAGAISAKECAAALNQIESVRKSAESAMDVRRKVREELAEVLLAVVDRVSPPEVYEAVVAELGRVEG